MSKTTDSISSTCVLCCSGITYFAVGPCNHHICLKCSTRMRVLCEQKYCSVCRAEMPKVIATTKLHPYNGIISHKYAINRKAGIAFATHEIHEEFRRLLWEDCPLCPLRVPEKNFKELQDHVRKDHELFYCDLCIKHLKVFSFERKTYSRKDLALHRRKGDVKDTSYRGHPMCEFCSERYFDNDELLRHLRQQHYFCHFCETDGVSNQYYNDYDNLKEHFHEQHYLCEEDSCAQEQFTHAFRSSIDLRAHKATAHSSQMSRAQARQMRQLDVEINLPPRPSERGGGGPGFVRGRDRRYYGHRDEDLSTAIQASMETSRRGISERRDVRRQDREERDARRTKDKPQLKKKPTASSESEDVRDSITPKPLKENSDDAGKGAVVPETVAEEAGMTREKRRVKNKGGRASPESEGENKTEETETKTKKSTGSLEDASGKQKSVASLADPTEAVKETGKKKKNNSKTVSEKADNANENVSLQSIKKPVDDAPSETSWTNEVKNEDYPPINDADDLNVKSAKLAWTTPDANVEDFPALGKSSKANARSTGAVGGFNFYSALQKMDTQPKPQKQPVALPAQRSFANKGEDFPTLSSIAGILGVDTEPSRTNHRNKSNNSAWTNTPQAKSIARPIETKQGTVKSKKKGKKSAKENQEVVISESIQKPPPGYGTQKKEATLAMDMATAPQGNQTISARRAPPGLPPGLPLKVSVSATVHTVSKGPPPPAASNPVSPPPGFGASISVSTSALPPGFNIYVHPSDFEERNLTLAKKIKAYLGNQEAKFDMFRSISRRYRSTSMTALEYYNECRILLGDNLPEIFNELVSLLPDVVKQQELISAQSDVRSQEKQRDNVLKIGNSEPVSSKGKGRGSGVWKSKANATASCSCPQCGQTIQRSELQAHLNMHRDFPTLSNSAVSKHQPITAAAPTWPRLK